MSEAVENNEIEARPVEVLLEKYRLQDLDDLNSAEVLKLTHAREALAASQAEVYATNELTVIADEFNARNTEMRQEFARRILDVETDGIMKRYSEALQSLQEKIEAIGQD